MRKALRQEEGKKKISLKKPTFNIKLKKRQIVILIVFVAVVLLVIAINNYTTLGLVLNKNITTDDTIQIELQTSNNKIIPFGNEILVYNKGVITSYNSYGAETGKITLEDTVEANILTSGKYIQVINKDKGLVYVYKNKYEVARIKIEGKIYSGSINEDGVSVIEYSENGNKTELGIYDNSGKKQYNIKLSNNIIGKYVLSDNSRYLAYVDINVSGISATTNINIIDLTNIKENQTNINTIYTLDNDLAYDIYWAGKTVVVRFDESYMLYDAGSGKKQIVELANAQIVNIGNYDKRYAYTQIDENGDYIVNIKKMTSESIKTIQLKETPKYFLYNNGIIYVCFSKKIEAYNNFGMNIKNYDSNMIITEPVVFNAGKSVVMSVSNKLIMFTI